MVKKINKKLLEKKGILSFDGSLYVLNEKKSIALFTAPYPHIKNMGIDKETEVEITIRIKPKDVN